MAEPSFQKEFQALLKDYVGRPSPLYFVKRLSAKYNTKIYLKREDLNHTRAHKSITPSDSGIFKATQHAKGAIIGSTFIKHLTNNGIHSIADFIASHKS